ncbi:MAG: hypothetical protein V4574_09950 [Pseudomonadota bacterium]
MPLLDLWQSNPETINAFNLQQIVSAAGDGDLKDGSLCSSELKAYFTRVTTSKLSNYIEQCLAQPLTKGGYILQDLVNELGRRLEYTVENGRYAGAVGHVGFDGLWTVPGQPIIVEVKTTDAYRISLDTLVTYREKLIGLGKCSAGASILIVVGRQDTGELEAQIRGSRHAWDIRLISAEALLRLVEVKESAGQADTDDKIRGLLRPTEYTRLDALVDVVFSATKDVETFADLGGFSLAANEPEMSDAVQAPYEFTSPADLNAKRNAIVSSWEKRSATSLVAKSRAMFWSTDHQMRAVCTLSKRYEKLPGRPYWYAYHPAWRDFLCEGKPGHLLLGMMDLDRAFAIPDNRLEPLLSSLHTTFRPDGKTYWHLHIHEGPAGELSLHVPGREALGLDQFSFALD